MDTPPTTPLSAPSQDLETLSFSRTAPDALADWIGRLPMANVQDSADQVRQATFEIARLKIAAPERMVLLETIRPTLHYLTARLDRTATGAAQHADATARLAQRLHTNLCSGYLAVILAIRGQAAEERKSRATLSLAIHRALSELSRTLLRTLQFYVAPADHLWLKLNQLYLLAERLGVTEDRQEDEANDASGSLSIGSAYLRPVLLTLARPYQLRPRHLTSVFHALGSWAHLASLAPLDDKDLHAINLASDEGPFRIQGKASGPALRGIRTEVLVYELRALRDGKNDDLKLPADFDTLLVNHLAGAWDKITPRAFGRSAVSEQMRVCIGMRAAHYYLSGGAELEQLIDRSGAPAKHPGNPFMKGDVKFIKNESEKPKDVWDHAFDVGRKMPENPFVESSEPTLRQVKAEPKPKAAQEKYRCYDATTVDTSPGGYRLRWREPFPPSLQAGEVIAIRGHSEHNWCMATLRWLRQDASGAFMGIELIAPLATPVAVRVIQTRGGEVGFQRAFLLSTVRPTNQPATLLTPATPFKAGQKVQLTQNGIQTTAQLGDCLLKTESFNQFTFRVLDGYLEKQPGPRNMGSQENLDEFQRTGFR